MSKPITLLVVLATLASPLAARAAFVSQGDYSFDTSTGLDWLNPNLTNNLSFQQVGAGAGGWTTNGWQYATDAQWRALMTAYVGAQNLTPSDGPTGGYYAASSAYTQSSLQVILTIGASYSFNDPKSPYNINGEQGVDQIGTQGYLAGSVTGIPGFGEVSAILADPNPGSSGLTTDAAYGRWFDETNFNASPGPFLGSFLVRADPTAVPEPASVGVFILALLVVGLMGSKGRSVGSDI